MARGKKRRVGKKSKLKMVHAASHSMHKKGHSKKRSRKRSRK